MAVWGHRLPRLLAALWWGGLTALSFVAVPLAFAHFGSPALAGSYAARLFQLQCWASLILSLLLMLVLRAREDKALLQDLLPWLLLAALAALLQEFGIAPRILGARAAGESVALWHRLGTILVLLQWLCALRTTWGLSPQRR
jgi:hypothetical protein